MDQPADARYGASMDIRDRILFIDGEAIIIDKPAGLAVDRPRGGGASLDDLLIDLRMGFQRLPLPVHRLDRDTSGCLLLARNPKALARFGQAFEQRMVEKRYVAVLAGPVEGDEGLIDQPLYKVSAEATGWRMVVDDRGKAAQTRWRVIGRDGDHTLVQFEPLTGRTHQIRAHAAYGLRAPVLGDPVYAAHLPRFAAGMVLHSLSISVPRDGKPPVAASAPVPALFAVAGFGEVAAAIPS